MWTRTSWALLLLACTAQTAPPPPPAVKGPAKKKANVKAVPTSNGVTASAPKLQKVSGDGCSDGAHKLDIPIVVNDGQNDWVFRDPKLARFMVPFSRAENLRSTDKLAVFDGADKRLPAQFEVLSRWDSHPGDCNSPIRFAYAYVSSAPTPSTVAQWRVKHLSSNPGELSPMTVKETADRWVIDTGAARFTLSRKGPDGLGKVEVRKGSGYVQVAKPGALVLEQPDGAFNAADGGFWKYELERAGPQVVTVLARGHYPSKKNKKPGKKAKDRGLGYTVRLHFYAGSTTVQIDHTYFFGVLAGWNANQATRLTQVKRAYLRVPLVGQPKQLYARMNTNILGLPANAAARIEQEKRTPGRAEVYYAIRSGGKIVESGGYGWLPFMAALTDQHYALATVARMAVRDPQGVTWNAKQKALEVEFTSSPIQVGSARGIWSTAAVDFGLGQARWKPSVRRAAARGASAAGHAGREVFELDADDRALRDERRRSWRSLLRSGGAPSQGHKEVSGGVQHHRHPAVAGPIQRLVQEERHLRPAQGGLLWRRRQQLLELVQAGHR